MADPIDDHGQVMPPAQIMVEKTPFGSRDSYENHGSQDEVPNSTNSLESGKIPSDRGERITPRNFESITGPEKGAQTIEEALADTMKSMALSNTTPNDDEPAPVEFIPWLLNAVVMPPQWQKYWATELLGFIKRDEKHLALMGLPEPGRKLTVLVAAALAAYTGLGKSLVITDRSQLRGWKQLLRTTFDQRYFRMAFIEKGVLTNGDILLDNSKVSQFKIIFTSYEDIEFDITTFKRRQIPLLTFQMNRSEEPFFPDFVYLITDFLSGKPDGDPAGFIFSEDIPITCDEIYSYLEPLCVKYVSIFGLHKDSTISQGSEKVTDVMSFVAGYQLAPIPVLRHNYAVAGARYMLVETEPVIQVHEHDIPKSLLIQSDMAYDLFTETALELDRRLSQQNELCIKSLVRARAYTLSPELLKITGYETDALQYMLLNKDIPPPTQDYHRALNTWRENMRESESWRSLRVEKIIELYWRHRQEFSKRKDSAVIIVSDSVYFLDILYIAFEMDAIQKDVEPIPMKFYDGRLSCVDRARRLMWFHNEEKFPRILLAAPGHASETLEHQFAADTLIICGPLVCQEWETQAVSWVFRRHLRKSAYVYEVRAHREEHDVLSEDPVFPKVEELVAFVGDTAPRWAREVYGLQGPSEDFGIIIPQVTW